MGQGIFGVGGGTLNQSAVHDVRLRRNGRGKTVQGLTVHRKVSVE